jgi:predicted  nucleic acid-binding Zn-ribbon protein
MEFKYISRFEVKADFKRNFLKNGSFVSNASMELEDLKSLLPDSEEIKNNPDLLYTCFNAAVINLINLNGDGITTEGAKILVESTKFKPMNIEHSREDIIGVITNYGFSSFGENKTLTEQELTDDPFNLSLAAIVWKISNKTFYKFILDSQDEDSEFFKTVSTSWEVGFNSYKLAVGSKDLRKAKIIDDEATVEEYSKYLSSMGGTGFLPTGEEVYRVIGDDCRFLGCAFTTNPAAAVQGVLSVDYRDFEEIEEELEEETEEPEEDLEHEMKEFEEGETEGNTEPEVTELTETEASIFIENQDKISLNKKNRVIVHMKYNNLDELIDHLHEAAASDVRDFVVSQVEKSNDQFVALKNEKAEKEQALENALANIKNFEDESQQLRDEVSELRASLKAQEDQAKFSERIESLKEQFDIDSAASKSIAKRIFGLSDEDFSEWLEDMKPLLKSKSTATVLEVQGSAINVAVPNSQAEKESKLENWTQFLSSIKTKISN